MDAYPLTAMQHGMLFDSLFAPESGKYVSQLVLRITAEGPGGQARKKLKIVP